MLLLCFFGVHDWLAFGEAYGWCLDCGKLRGAD